MLDVAQTEEMLQVLEPTTLPVLAPVTVKSAASASGGGWNWNCDLYPALSLMQFIELDYCGCEGSPSRPLFALF
jgi:hypothetical protein